MSLSARVFELTGRALRALRALVWMLRHKRRSFVVATPHPAAHGPPPYYTRHMWDPFAEVQVCMYCAAVRSRETEDEACVGVKLRRVSGLN